MDVIAVIISGVAFFLVMGARMRTKAAMEAVARLESKLRTLENRGAVSARETAEGKAGRAAVGSAGTEDGIERPDYAAATTAGVVYTLACPSCGFMNRAEQPHCERCGTLLHHPGKSPKEAQPLPPGIDLEPPMVSAAASTAIPRAVSEGAPSHVRDDVHGSGSRPSSIGALLDKLKGTEEWEALIGGRWMNRIGAVALILGMGFFLKYAIDSNWIFAYDLAFLSPAYRSISFVVLGVILIGVSYLYQRYRLDVVGV